MLTEPTIWIAFGQGYYRLSHLAICHFIRPIFPILQGYPSLN